MKLKTFVFTWLALATLSFGQTPFTIEQYQRYLQQLKMVKPQKPGVEQYQTPQIYETDTIQMKQLEFPTMKPFPQETLPYFDEPVVIEGETVQVIRKAAPKYLKIYGSDFFQQTQQVFTAQQPVSGDYALGSGDQLLLNLWGSINAQYELMVDREGKIYIPQVGEVIVGGLSLTSAEQNVKKALSKAYKDFHASLTLGVPKTIKVFVVGQVNYPGVYNLPGLSRIMTALAAAGGPDSTGSYREITVYRGDKPIACLDIYEFIGRGYAPGNIQLANGDVVVTPTYYNRIKLRGYVKEPAIYELKPNETISDLLRYSGGPLPDGNIRSIFIDRIVEGKHVALSIDLTDSIQSKSVMKDGDDVSIFATNPIRGNVVFLEGYVPRPGAYGWFDGMKVSDVFVGHGALFSDTYMERINILRLMPDYRYQIIPVNLGKALAGDAKEDLLLKPQDRLVVVSAQTFKTKKYVRISGAVRHPGIRELCENMRISDLIFLAGGTEEYALLDSAELVRLLETGISERRNIPLAKILANPEIPENLQLQNEDYLFVRKVPKWRQTQLVTILGEVTYPGTYALLSEDETLSHLLERAGGTTDNSFLEGALFIRPGIGEQFARRNILRVVRSTQEISRDSLGQLDTTLLVFTWNPIDLNRVIVDMSLIVAGLDDIVLEPFDTIYIPKRPDGVSLVGAVSSNGTVKYTKNKNVKFYIERAGGFTRNADENEIRLVKPNGRVFKVSPGYDDVSPGDVIVVPQRIKTETDFLRSMRDIISILSGVATTIYIILKL